MWEVMQTYADMRNASILDPQVETIGDDALIIDAECLVGDVSTVSPAIS